MTVKQIEGYQIYMNKLLGKGSYGSVFIGKKDHTNEPVAVKILPKQSIDHDDYLKAALKNEIEILQKLHSDNIVAFYDVMQSSKNYYIIQELCDGDLSKDIKRGYNRPQIEAIQMLKQICNGFLTLVRQGIIHRDLKPANIMKKGHFLKLGDFGFAKQMESKSQMVATTVGTPLYMSLQILKGQSYTSKCDIWALGFIFYEILHGQTPWTANTQVQLVRNIQKIPLSIRRKDLSNQTVDFLARTLKVHQSQRMSWDEIFVHPIFQGEFANLTSNRQFQNKLKMILNKLRFYISRNNLDLHKIMDSMGFTSHVHEIPFHDFYSFLKNAYPQITTQQAAYCFKKTDTDNSQSISVNELKHMLLENGIKLDRQFQSMPRFQRQQSQTFTKISRQTSNKLQSCFQKLYKIITKNKLSLWKVFNDFDKKKGSLTLAQFTLLIKKLSGTTIEISDQEIRMGFELIDQDNSNSIQFNQLNQYYSKINGIPMSSNMPYEPMQIEYGQQNRGQQPVQFGSQGSISNNPFQQINQAFSQGRGYQNFVNNNNFHGNMSYPGQHQGYQQQNPNQSGHFGQQGYQQQQNYQQQNNQGPPQFPGGNFNPFDLLRRQ